MQQQQQHRREAEHLRRTYARKKTPSSVRPRRRTPAPTQTQTQARRAPTLDSRSIPSPPFICGDSETQNYPSDLAAAADAVAVRDQSFGIGRQRRYRRSSETVFFGHRKRLVRVVFGAGKVEKKLKSKKIFKLKRKSF